MKKLKSLIMYFFFLPPYLISKLVPKDENVWMFGSWFGEKYADNSRFLFEYVNNEQPRIRAIWISRDRDIIRNLRTLGYEAYYLYSPKAILLSMRCMFSVFVQSNKDDVLMHLNNGKTKLIQLWHGIPLKKIGYDDQLAGHHNNEEMGVKKLLFPYAFERHDLVISCGVEDQSNFVSAFRNNNVSITGYPRNDILFRVDTDKIRTKSIVYLPTYREGVGHNVDMFSNFSFDLVEWQKYLSAEGVVLYIKMHPVNVPPDKVVKLLSQSRHIVFLGDVDVGELLTEADLLITDYSSVYFDYLLTGKPIIFAPFDYSNYLQNERDLYYQYEDLTPGPKCKDWCEVLKWTNKFKKDASIYSLERTRIKNRFHEFQDGFSSERVFRQMELLIGK
ncbi:MAG: CDP-glycerol glycerophosphotransferase family protein [Pseudomonadales bacterium]|nr:CDP-glycerol glycerophosphotransferase family protein [Pseudomonadales bacterium]